MKKITFIIALIISINSQAQDVVVPTEGSYYQNADLDKFVGTWRWTSGADTMIIILQKQKIHYSLMPVNFDDDAIVGWHRYVKNGILIESDLQYANTPFRSNPSSFFGGTGATNNPNVVRFTTFYDISKRKTSDNLYFTKIKGTSPAQATWVLENSQGMETRPYDYSFTVPTNMTFIKQ